MKNLTLICEAKLNLGQTADESQSPSGKIEAVVTTWGKRIGEDGRRFNYQPEGFAQWADEFAKDGKPLPMFLNHNADGMPVGEWNEFTFDEKGMTASGKLYMSTVGGSDLYEVLKNSPRMFGGVSVGAYADEARMVDEDGNPIFQKADKPELMRGVDPTIIMRIMTEMNDPDNQVKIDTALGDRKSTRLNSSHSQQSRMPSSA